MYTLIVYLSVAFSPLSLLCSLVTHIVKYKMLTNVLEDPDKLKVRKNGHPLQIYTAGRWLYFCIDSYMHIFLYISFLICTYLNILLHTFSTTCLGASYCSSLGDNSHSTRLPAAHPEGYVEALANIYKSFYEDVEKRRKFTDVNIRQLPLASTTSFPNLNDGIEGMEVSID